MNRIRFRSPLRAVIYEMRGLFLWWGVLAAFTSACSILSRAVAERCVCDSRGAP